MIDNIAGKKTKSECPENVFFYLCRKISPLRKNIHEVNLAENIL